MQAMGKGRENPDPASTDHPYGIRELADKYGLSEKAAGIILYSNGPSRVACDAGARAFLAAQAARSPKKKISHTP
jgi:hypothetical protein